MKKNKIFDFHYPVFIPAALIVLLFVSVAIILGEPLSEVFLELRNLIYDKVGWFFIFTVNTLLVVAIILAFSKFGKIKLGGRSASPDFSNFAWYSMLFSAGMGIGLIFYGVAEPVQHFASPPIPVNNEVDAARQAFKFTFLHYGLHPWAVYGMIALAFAFFTFNRKLPLTVRSLFAPLLGKKIHGIFGHVVDVLAVIACLFGLATTLGFGAQQVGAGLNFLFGIDNNVKTQIIFIGITTLLATASIVSGLDKGVKILSVLNIRIAVIFMILMLIIGPTVFLLDSFIENIGMYAQNLIELGTFTEVYAETKWQNNWTIFYWAWWIAWSPFVGIFIARISRGRTIREFLTGVIILPTLFSFLWFTVFGSTAIHLELNEIANISGAVSNDISTALFEMLKNFPFSSILSVIAILLIISFFVTSSDSGSLVVDFITTGGKLDAPVGTRIFWALIEGLLAISLLIGGGLGTLQTAVMLAAFPFAIILLVMTFSLLKGLRRERLKNLRNKVKRNARVQNSQFEKYIDDNEEE
ncbi:BCCT family transporter [Aestuariibaculum sediminum]|uniref:BCCT family transporter n=1 Tax=Aestuariibaculum sediminum TaxID=2770637 RepID=A0A8J6QCH5_9FLAO|nr:BCCT family transporter [Aestuariibaculum sediminum]MBD0833601.1 BCCT family transporter [Aestuariibaculum sediminum]